MGFIARQEKLYFWADNIVHFYIRRQEIGNKLTRKPQTGKNFMYMESSLELVPDWVAEGAAEKWEKEKWAAAAEGKKRRKEKRKKEKKEKKKREREAA